MSSEPLIQIDTAADLYADLLEQYKYPRVSGGESRLSGIIALVASEAQLYETALQEMLSVLDVSTVEGVQLDVLGRICQTDREGASDDAYRAAIEASISRASSGTAEQVIQAVKDASGASDVEYTPEYPALFWISVSTPMSVGLVRALFDRVSPAGVQGLWADELVTADGSLVETAGDSDIFVVHQ